MSCDQVRFSVSAEGVATITLDDPISRNALSNSVIEELARLFHLCEYDSCVKLVILRGANGTFSSGGNIRTLKEQIDNHSWDRGALGHLCDAGRRLKDLSKPTVCVIDGPVAGAGISLAMACDFSIAAETTKFTFAFINLALVPDTGASELLVRTAGVCKAKELLLTDAVFSAEDAAKWQLITWALPPEDVEQRLEKLVKKLLNTSPAAYRRIKTLINQCAYPQYDATLSREAEYQYDAFLSEDHREGVNAFLEKRIPKFQGR